MDDIECINVKRNELRMKNSELNTKSVDDCIIVKNKVDAVENVWLKIEQVYKKEIINEQHIDRQRQKGKVRYKKEYLWYLQYKIDQFEEKEEDLSTRITNFECDIEYITRKLVRLEKINEKLKLPMEMSEKERDEKIKKNELNHIMEMKDKHERLRRRNKIIKEQLAKAREDLEQLKDEGKALIPEPEPQALAPDNNNTQHGFLTRKCIAIKCFFMKKFNRRN